MARPSRHRNSPSGSSKPATGWKSSKLSREADRTYLLRFRTNTFTYSNGLVYSQTDERGLSVTNYYDALQRPTGRLYPDSTYTTNIKGSKGVGPKHERGRS